MDNSFQENITNKIVNYALVFIAIIALPLNVIIYFAISKSQSFFIHLFPIILSAVVIFLSLYRNRIKTKTKVRSFSLVLFCAGLYTLLLGLLDMASLWFVLSVIFILFDENRKIAFGVFILAVLFSISIGMLMIFKNPHIPLDYGFEDCQFACVSIRILNFLIIGFLILRILKMFFSTINLYINEISEKIEILERLKITEKNKADERLKNQKLNSDIEKNQLEIRYKQHEIAVAAKRIMQFNTLLDNIKKSIIDKEYKQAILQIISGQSESYNLDNFIVELNELYPSFELKIKELYPQLTKTELKVCILIIAGLKSVEIAEILNVSDTSIAKYRNRIRKKINLDNKADISDSLIKVLKNS